MSEYTAGPWPPTSGGTSEHTPGPWEPYWVSPSFWRITRQGKDIAATEANTRLMAAAPELLEALEALVGLWDDSTWDKARAAIAKAKGETT